MLKKSLFALCILLFSSCSNIQDVFVAADNKQQVDGFTTQAEKIVASDPLQAQALAQKALDIAQKSTYNKGMGNAHFLLGQAFDYQGQYPQAVKHHLKAIKYRDAIGDKEGLIQSYNNLGIIYLFTKIYKDSEKEFKKALELAEKINSKQDQAKIQHNLGRLFRDQGHLRVSREWYMTSLDMYKTLGDLKHIGYVSNELAIVYESGENPDYKMAYEQYKKSLELNEKSAFKEGCGWSSLNTGRMLLKLNQPAKALEYLRKAEYFLQNDYKNLVATHTSQVEAYVALKNIEAAKISLIQAENLEVKLTGAKKENLLDAYKLAQSLYPDKAVFYQDKARKIETEMIQIKGEVFRSDTQTRAEIEGYGKDYYASMYEIQRQQNNLLFVFVSISVVLAIGIFILFLKYRARKAYFQKRMAIMVYQKKE